VQKFWFLLLVLFVTLGCRGNVTDFELARRAIESEDIAQLRAVTKEMNVNYRLVSSNPYLGNSTLLHQAVESKNLEAVKHLLSTGADPNLKNDLGQSSLMLAVGTHKPDSDSLAILTELIRKGGDVNAKENKGATLLKRAATLWKSTDYQDLLIKHGAKTQDGATNEQENEQEQKQNKNRE